MKVARQLKRNSIGIEIIRDLEKIIRKKIGFDADMNIFNQDDKLEIIIRNIDNYKSFTIEFSDKEK